MESIVASRLVLFLLAIVFSFYRHSVDCAFSIFPNENSTFGQLHRENVAKPSLPLPRKNIWELISSSSDFIPVRNSSSLQNLLPSRLSVETRLQKLEFNFNTLKIYDEDCRQRMLCEIAENPSKFAPLSNALLEETSYNGDDKVLASGLLSSNEGARLLTYIEAARKGFTRSGCDTWTYRCPQTAISMIDYKSLLVWREVSKWLTVKFIAKRS